MRRREALHTAMTTAPQAFAFSHRHADGPDTDGRHDGGGRTVLMMAGQIDVMPILPMVTDRAAS